MIKNLIFLGQIPYFKWIKRVLAYLPLVALLIFVYPTEFKIFGQTGWYILLFVIFIRPLADILPKLGIFRTITILRKELGILAGVFILTHGIGFFLKQKLFIIPAIFQAEYWDFGSYLAWGATGFFLTLIIILTSNRFAIKSLGKYWKPIQRLTYLLFIVAAIHIGMQNGEILEMGIIVGSFVILWVLANRKVVLWK